MRQKFLSAMPYAAIAVLGLSIFLVPLQNADEIWNYNFARTIYDGLLPYRDFNIVTTPLSSYLAALFLSLFGNELFSYRIAGYVLWISTFFLLYKFCKDLLKQRTMAFVATVFAGVLNLILWIYNYNNLNLLILLAVMYLEYRVRTDRTDLRRWIYLGIGFFVGLAPLVKQTTGMMLVLANAVICLMDWIRNRKQGMLLLSRVGVSLLPGIMYCIILFATGTMDDFLEYTVLGLGSFTHKITVIDYATGSAINFLIALFPIVVAILMVIRYRKKPELRPMLLILAIYTVAGTVVAYPLSDHSHFIIALTPMLPGLFLGMKIPSYSKNQKVLCNAVASILTLFVVIYSIPDFGGDYKWSQLSHYKGIPIAETLENHIANVQEYIREKNTEGTQVLITDTSAAVYMIPLDQYHKNFDLMNVGNLGTASVEELLDVENTVFLVPQDFTIVNSQAHTELMVYIQNNYLRVGEVEGYDVFAEKS